MAVIQRHSKFIEHPRAGGKGAGMQTLEVGVGVRVREGACMWMKEREDLPSQPTAGTAAATAIAASALLSAIIRLSEVQLWCLI